MNFARTLPLLGGRLHTEMLTWSWELQLRRGKGKAPAHLAKAETGLKEIPLLQFLPRNERCVSMWVGVDRCGVHIDPLDI